MSDPSGPDWHRYEPTGRPMPDGPAEPSEPPDGMADTSLIGQVGVVQIAVPGGERPGEVLVRHRGVAELFLAFAGEPVERGVEVRVTSVRGPRQVGVTPTTA